jgi:D-arabinose 1-dehydrogenase-like Zn-dependent alcohol dehydrogenase
LKALTFEKNDIEDLKYSEVEKPKIKDNEVLLKVVKAGVTQLDYMTITSMKVNPVPHIPGSEFAGIVEEIGDNVQDIKEGDKVAVYTRTFDSSCKYCKEGLEMLCKSGKRIGIDENGGYAEYVKVVAKNVIKADLDWNIMPALSISALASYHALKSANIQRGDIVVVFGSSGNAGIFASQLAEIMGARVIPVSNNEINGTVRYDNVEEEVKNVSDGEMADIVINPLGSKYWDLGVKVLKQGGKMVFFGTLTGSKVTIDLSQAYLKHLSFIGTVRGTFKEFKELTEICKKCKPLVWKEFPLEEGKEALLSLFSRERKGRILISIS